ncbi:TetR/AcrR family transcriptional regulator [Clostridium sp. Sa3CUN1]|uniref:TetR/AcrR family transcriptional regulator n=1 Tax=Clostridium gallinarum TaxID=2762246 RepID=A0ABR8Q4X7_9CLOT|nr:TetR/AcrR family transcriptional regulator [Clostridium gallinarum]MBD7915461.1 TetR/AcrR family transcriptional regulator [Clostridium gallinarum]
MPKILQNPRETILKEGYALLEEKGYKNFSMRELANRCEIGLGTVYNYFENKMSLVREIFNDTWSEIINNLKLVKNNDISFEEKVKLIYLGLEKFLVYHKEVFFELTKEEKNFEEKKSCSCPKYNVLDELYIIVDEIIDLHKENNDITINIETRKLTSFLISNMITLSMKNTEFSIEDLLYIVRNKL